MVNKRSLLTLEPITIDYSESWIPKKAKKLKPHVYKDGETYCCMYGPDPDVGVFGCGDTLHDAVINWEHDLDERIARLTTDDHAAHLASANLDKEN